MVKAGDMVQGLDGTQHVDGGLSEERLDAGGRGWSLSGVLACVVVGCALGVMGALCEIVFTANAYRQFMLAASEAIDGQSFFMFGTVIAGMACAGAPAFIGRRAGVISILGVLAFSLILVAGYMIQGFSDACTALAPLMLAVWSVSFNFVKLPLIYMLIEIRNFPLLVLCMALSRSILIVASFGVLLLDSFLQCACIFTGAFLCIALTAWSVSACSRLIASPKQAVVPENLSKLPLGQMMGRTIFVCISAATLRILSPLGSVGGFDAQNISFTGSVVAAMGVLALTYIVFLYRANPGNGQGFGAAPFVITGGLFIAIFGFIDVDRAVMRWAAVLVLLLYSFAHVAYWDEVAAIVWRLSGAGMRVIGGAMALYAVCEFLWRVAFQNIGGSVLFLIIAVAYISMIAIWRFFPNVKGVPSSEESSEGERLREYAARCSLSPRETEIFLLLARGYSRRKIQEKLGLSDGTVKTYASRVYRKLGVAGKQEMLALLYGDANGCEDEIQ